MSLVSPSSLGVLLLGGSAGRLEDPRLPSTGHVGRVPLLWPEGTGLSQRKPVQREHFLCVMPPGKWTLAVGEEVPRPISS